MVEVGNKGQRLVVANWKMNHTIQQAETFAREFTERMLAWYEQVDNPLSAVQVVVCPPFTALSMLRPYLAQVGAFLGAQNVHWEDHGAYTGEISAPMLLESGCTYVIVGHSERRQYAREDDDEIAERLAAALRHGLQPILCVGENERERQDGKAAETVHRQLETVLRRVRGELLGRELIVAYEPVWAIGSGKAATPADAAEMSRVIREKWRVEMQGQAHCRVLYGGSVKADNLSGFLTEGNMDGALVGGASLEAASFFAIIQAAVTATQGGQRSQ